MDEILEEARGCNGYGFMFTSMKSFLWSKTFAFETDYYLGREYWLIPETKTNNITVNIFIIIEDN